VLNGDVMRRSSIGFGLLVILIALMVAPTGSGQASLLLIKSDSYVSIGENLARERVILEYAVSQSPENILRDNLRIRGAISSVSVYDSEGRLSFSVDYLENGWSLVRYTLRDTLRAGDRTQVTIEFMKAVENIGGNRAYKIQYRWSTPPTSYQVIAKLPRGSSLISTSENPSEFYTENESQYMRYSGVMMSSFQTYIVFKVPPSEGAQPPEEGPQAEEGQTPLLYVVLAIAAVASLISVWAIRRTRAIKPPKAPERAPEVMPRVDIEKILGMLHENERKIIEELIKEDGLTQATLCGRTGIPKATMSRVLQRLEGKGLVRRVGYGMSKKVMLTGLARRWKE